MYKSYIDDMLIILLSLPFVFMIMVIKFYYRLKFDEYITMPIFIMLSVIANIYTYENNIYLLLPLNSFIIVFYILFLNVLNFIILNFLIQI